MTQSIDVHQERQRLSDRVDVLEVGLTAAIRAAKLALFVIRKQGVMPNSSWEAGFEKDMATANAARGDQQLPLRTSSSD